MKVVHGRVAFFDSGIGGLTVLAACKKRFPDEYFYYYGDNRHAPYGNLDEQRIRRYVFTAFDKFQHLRVKAAVVACNTVTALCIDELRARYSFPIIGAEPAVLTAARRGGVVWVLTTRATYNSERFVKLCTRAREKYPKSVIKPIACDCLAGTIEANIKDKNFNYMVALPRGDPDTVVLGCTHYIYIKEQIRAYYGCEVFDGNEGIAKRLSAVLNIGQNLEEKNEPKMEVKTAFLKKVGMNDHLVTTTPKNANECSCFCGRTTCPQKRGEKLVFLGKSKGKNAKIYKQTFVF